MKTINEPQVVSVSSFVKATQIAQSTFYKYAAAGAIQTVKLGKRRFVPIAELERILREGMPTVPKEPRKAA